ncbi:MAG: exodeoxyribonuclease VII small subunit [Acidobacteriota bacterium]
MSKNDKTIQEKMNQLSELVAWFESDEFELEAAIEKYKTAEVLADEIGKDLSELKNEITVLKEKFDS